MFKYEFMINAFSASGIIAILSGVVGYFLVLREQTFAGHALSHVGFTGATGAALLGIPPLWGMIGFTLVVGIIMGILGEKLSTRDVGIGIILSLSFGFGLLFLYFFTSYATQINGLLFGNILCVNKEMLMNLFIITLFCLISISAIARPLLFSSIQPELAEAKGVSLQKISIIFLSITSLAVAACSQIVGVLLVFTLMVGPSAAAQNFTSKIIIGIILSILFSIIQAWVGISLSFYTNWPTSFWITTLAALFYGISILFKK